MKSIGVIFKTFILSVLIIAQVHFSYAQTASILPPAKTTFLDSNGNPLAGGKVHFYIPGTTSAKTTWQDSGETIPNANPVILDSAGRGIILGDGSYRQQVFDKLGNLIWDQQTSSTGSGGGGTTATVGDGDAVGTVKPWSGFVAPSAYVFAYGQTLARASFPLLFATLTSQQNISCTSGSAVLTGLSDTSQFPVGAAIESICLNAGATVVSTTISSVTASSNAIISTSTSARFFPFGDGDGSLSFNVPDLRGRVLAGRDNMGSIAASRLTSAATGCGVIAAIGANCGNQSSTLAMTNLPASSVTVSGSTSQPTLSTGPVMSGLANGSSPVAVNATSGTVNVFPAADFASANVIPFTGNTANLGSGTAFPNVQPTEILNYIIKTLPDTNANSFFGVASIGGMFGVITCGTGVSCSGNQISAIAPTAGVSSLGGATGDIAINGGAVTSSTLEIYGNGGVFDAVKQFGADPTGASNSATAIRNTILAACPNTGQQGTVYIPAGHYLVNGGVNVTGVNQACSIRGAGQISTVLFTTASTNAILDFVGSAGITVSDLQVNGLTGNVTNYGILLAPTSAQGCDVFRFDNISVVGNWLQAGVYIYGCSDSQFNMTQVSNFYTGAVAVVAISSTNFLGATSNFTTIDTGTLQAGDWNFISFEIHDLSTISGGTSTVLPLFISGQFSPIKFLGGVIAGAPTGNAGYVQLNGTNSVSFIGSQMYADNGLSAPYAIYNAGSTISGLTVQNTAMIVTTSVFDVANSTIWSGLTFTGNPSWGSVPVFSPLAGNNGTVTGSIIQANGQNINVGAASGAITNSNIINAGTVTAATNTGNNLINGGPLGTPSSGVATHITGLPIATGLTGAGTGVLTALGVNVGTAGSPVINGGALGVPTSGDGSALTGTASGLTAGHVTTNANLTGDITSSGNATTLATVNVNTGAFGSATQCVTVTNNAKGLTTAVSAATCAPAIGSITGLGTGVATALGGSLNGPGGIVGYNGNFGAAAGASVTINGQYTSTVSTGTAPLVIASTTNVPNLNASSLNGATFAVPGAIGSGTASSGAFSTLSASSAFALNNGGSWGGTISGTPTLSGANFVTLANLAQSTAGASFLGVTGSSAGNYAPFTLASLTNIASPSATLDLIPIVDHTTGTIKNVTPGAIAASSVAGVSSLNTATGAITLLTEPQGRLTLQANTPVMATSQTAQTTLRYDAYIGNQVPYFNGTNDAIDTISSNEVADALVSSGTAGSIAGGFVFDVWWVHSGANRICIATSNATSFGQGWSGDTGGSNTTRGTGFSQLDRITRPYVTNKNSITNCFNAATNYGPVSANQGTYLGTVYASGNGQISYTFGGSGAGGVAGLFGVWNMYNRVNVMTLVEDTASSWSLAAGTTRAADNSTTNRVSFVSGIAEDGFSATYSGIVSNSATGQAGFGVMFDSVTTFTGQVGAVFTGSFFGSAAGTFSTTPLGFHFFQAGEASANAGTQTFFGSPATYGQVGMSASLRM